MFGEYSGKLNNAGENIKLVDSDGETILEFEYGTITPWPEAPDGYGPSLQVIDIFGDYNDPSNWKASEKIDGTPALLDDEQTSWVEIWSIH